MASLAREARGLNGARSTIYEGCFYGGDKNGYSHFVIRRLSLPDRYFKVSSQEVPLISRRPYRFFQSSWSNCSEEVEGFQKGLAPE